MTVESLMNTFTKYASWLYTQRQWARWELMTIALTAMVLLLFILVHRRRSKAKRAAAKQLVKKPSTIEINLDASKKIHQQVESGSDSSGIVSISKNSLSRRGWKKTTKKWKNLQKLTEQLQEETAKYRQAQELLEQQFARLKAANERLRQEIVGSGHQIIQELESESEPETGQPRIINDFGKQPGRIVNPAGVNARDS